MNDIRNHFDRILFISLGVIIIVATGWYLVSPFWEVVKKNEPLPVGEVLAIGAFIPQSHAVEGEAVLFNTGNKRVLRFEGFKSINGPGLHVYLAFNTDNRHFIDLGPLRATEGNVNYDIPSSVDMRRYTTVLVWSEALQMLFSYAELRYIPRNFAAPLLN